MTTSKIETETDVIEAEPTALVLSSGLPVEVERLRTRQTMRLLKILTRGAGFALSDLSQARVDGDGFMETFLLTVVLAIPEAEEETVAFVRSMVTPVGLIDDPRTQAEHEVNANLIARVDAEFENPDLDDLVAVLERVVRVEGPHLQALGKRLAVLLKAQQQNETAKQGSASSAKKSSGSTRTRS